ncbi:hypothetical protein [Legionella maioricensis]|uniref:Gamma-glutamylcyclotransferase AIG2-like domain-containing protein n=1 Tax=Legionella maioricensis TaxID=2896528 RepID=A0A9X2D1B2_9GAMM|nr:hypothetical protein [Legionella maioricensis]MCL9684524.1 hypothetical protein [Legionella maioricensis]MCL9687882.1 hypothetical protein [Legionella maioricensis]
MLTRLAGCLRLKIFVITLFLVSPLAQARAMRSCHPPINPSQPQYIVGYGSLMSEDSKKTSAKNSGDNIPVTITGYQRGWFLKGPAAKYSATFLGIKSAVNQRINGVVFNLPDSNELLAIDEREQGYCRQLVELNSIQPLTADPLPQAQYWIYVPEPEQIALANKQYPIVQSYVDIFLSGCIQMEKKYHLSDYARQCITTTSDWSPQWVNDRIHPRRPWSSTPEAAAIDKLLSEEVADSFNSIVIEGSING